MGSTGRRFSVRAGEPTWIQDWVDAELVERVEVVEARVASLDLERDGLEAELAERTEAIEAGVALLDAERTELETAFAERIELIEALVESLDHEHDWLETELSVAQSWVQRTAPLPQAEPLEQVAEAAEEARLLVPEAAPPQRLTLALLALFALVPWAVIAAVAYAVWLLL
jgi:chaperonin cofactor prefoldin